jgi:hypothetical protein
MSKKGQSKVPGMSRPSEPVPQEIQLPPKRIIYENGALYLEKIDMGVDAGGNPQTRFHINIIVPGEMVTLVLDNTGKEALIQGLTGGVHIARPGDVPQVEISR